MYAGSHEARYVVRTPLSPGWITIYRQSGKTCQQSNHARPLVTCGLAIDSDSSSFGIAFAFLAAEGKCIRQFAERRKSGLSAGENRDTAPNQVPEDRMLEIRQSAGVGAVTTMIFLDDLSRWVGFPKVGDNGHRFRILPSIDQKKSLPQHLRKIAAPFGCAGSRTRSRQKYEETGGGLAIIADVLQKAFEDQKCSRLCVFQYGERSATSTASPSQPRERAEGTFERVS